MKKQTAKYDTAHYQNAVDASVYTDGTNVDDTISSDLVGDTLAVSFSPSSITSSLVIPVAYPPTAHPSTYKEQSSPSSRRVQNSTETTHTAVQSVSDVGSLVIPDSPRISTTSDTSTDDADVISNDEISESDIAVQQRMRREEQEEDKYIALQDNNMGAQGSASAQTWLFADADYSKRPFLDSLMKVSAPLPSNAQDRTLIAELFVPLTCSYVFTRDLRLAGFQNTNEHDFIPLYRLAEQRLRGSLTPQARCDLLLHLSKNSLGQKFIKYSPLTSSGTLYVEQAPTSTKACQILADLRDMGSAMTPSHVGLLIQLQPLPSARSALVELVTSTAFAPFIQLLFSSSTLTFALVAQALARCLSNIASN